MIRKLAVASCLTLSLLAPALCQTTAPPVQKQREEPEGNDVVRITSNLVQVDAVVTVADGRQVKGLTADDFEIREDGRPKQITSFSYVELYPGTPASSAAKGGAPQPVATRDAAPPPVRLSADKVRRTVALVVDDAYMSFGSFGAVRDTLKKFVAERYEPNDLVGVFRTGGGGVFQQFTSDRSQLALAVRRLDWRPGDHPVDIFEPARRDFETINRPKPTDEHDTPDAPAPAAAEEMTRRARERAQYFRVEPDDPPVITTLRFLLHDMRALPGRKAVVVFSDGLSLAAGDGDATSRRAEQLRRLADYANRSGVAIYTVDARGLANPDFIGADEDVDPNRTSELRAGRATSLWESKYGLNYLAEETGGTFTRNNNDLDTGLRRAFEEQRGYYLLGYRPSDDAFEGGVRRFRKLEVSVKRPGLRVRSRKGFLDISDDVLAPPRRTATGDSQLYAALASPLAAPEVSLRLTPFVEQDGDAGPSLRVLLHIDASGLTFTDEADGWKRLTLDVAAVTFGEDGRVANEFTRTHTVRVGPETLALVKRGGLVYAAGVPLRSPGAYQLRVAVRDGASKRLGSASQFVEVPDLKSGAFALSALVLSEETPGGVQELPPAAAAEAALSPVQSPSNPAVRRFLPGAALHYTYQIHNARPDAATKRPQLTTQVRLFHDGQQVFAGPEKPFDPGPQADTKTLRDDGLLRLGADAAPGEYVLQITVTEKSGGGKSRAATQWIDFEIAK
ncbi:MAG: VWA domain-containing protein [Acidobacteria bacterium]|nr:VWA domain-containing protein [Acidobacteriota bacterium]